MINFIEIKELVELVKNKYNVTISEIELNEDQFIDLFNDQAKVRRGITTYQELFQLSPITYHINEEQKVHLKLKS